jgi:hypothetical protein
MSEYYWCLAHERVEEGPCGAIDRLGPYDSPDAARAWRDRVEDRNDAWQAEDERWDDADDTDDADDDPDASGG